MNESMTRIFKSTMQKEIFEQPDVVRNLFKAHINENNTISLNIPNDIENAVIIASGSSYNCAAIGANLLKETVGVSCEYEYSSEFILQKRHLINPKTLYIFISQSGETSDTLKALNIVKEFGGRTMCVTNGKDSALWKGCEYKILSDAGVEKSIASTKALCAQILCMMFIVLKVKELKGENLASDMNELRVLPEYLESIIANKKIDEVAKVVSGYDNIAVLGNRNFYSIACEGTLKMKETSYLKVMAYPFGEFLHGHVAILNTKAVMIAIIDEENEVSAKHIIEKILKDYQPKVVCISSVKAFNCLDCGDTCINIHNSKFPGASPLNTIFGTLITLQLIACEVASILGNNPDQPKGLSKVVLD